VRDLYYMVIAFVYMALVSSEGKSRWEKRRGGVVVVAAAFGEVQYIGVASETFRGFVNPRTITETSLKLEVKLLVENIHDTSCSVDINDRESLRREKSSTLHSWINSQATLLIRPTTESS
jgi:hypothetical protein